MVKAKVNDIFVSIQGEGKFLGEEQCFVRFYGCNLSCRFCDTKISTYTEYSCEELVHGVKEVIGDKSIKFISITGGEPLLQKDFLIEFLPRLKANGFGVYLETNGVLHEELFDVMPYVDSISMDIKLPSSTKERSLWQEHRQFLKIAREKEVFIKAVICLDTTFDDFKKAVNLVAGIAPEITFVLQPNELEIGRDLVSKLQAFHQYSKGYFTDARIIPQLHKILGVK